MPDTGASRKRQICGLSKILALDPHRYHCLDSSEVQRVGVFQKIS